jgi:hypothetical protein
LQRIHVGYQRHQLQAYERDKTHEVQFA